MAGYARDLLHQLKFLAAEQGHAPLAYLIEIAELQARAVWEDEKRRATNA